LSINNSRFAEFLPLIYPPELEFKETTDTASSASFLDLYLEFDDSGQLIIDEELQHIDHLFLGVACFTFLNLLEKYVEL
jgi:hypothetical protein